MTSAQFGPTTVRSRWSRYGWIVGVVVVLAAIAFPYVVDRPRFWLPNIGIRSIWLGIIAMSLVFLNRYVGLLSLAQGTIGGISAYGVGYFSVTVGLPVLVAAPLGIVAGTIAGFITALIAGRTRAIYFLMITLALGQVFYSWASQAIEITNARRGLAPIRRPDLGVVDLGDLTYFYFLALAVAVFCYVLCRYVAASSFGLALQGVRDSPDRMRALGYRVDRYRVAAITFAAFIASVGGVILVLDRGQVDPDVVSLSSTLDILVVAVIGGIGSLGGVFVGAILLTLLDNFAQDVTNRYMTLTGVIFILILLFAPAGLAGIGRQVTTVISGRRRQPSLTAGDQQQDPPASPPAAEALTKGTQR